MTGVRSCAVLLRAWRSALTIEPAPKRISVSLFERRDCARILALWTKTHGCSVSLHSGVPIRSAVEYLSDGRAVPFLELSGDELRGVTLVAGTPRIFLLQ